MSEAFGGNWGSKVKSDWNAVLVVDDEPDMLSGMQGLLEDLHFRTFTAQNHLAAMETFRANRQSIGLVITDLKMDRRTAEFTAAGSAGTELIDWLKAQRAQCRIGVLTAYGEYSDFRVKMRNPKVAFYLGKDGDNYDAIERCVLEAMDDRALAVRADDAGAWQEVTDHPGKRCSVSFETGFSRQASDNVVQGTLRFDLGSFRYRTIPAADATYLDLEAAGASAQGRPGGPALPMLTQRVALPVAVTDLSVELVDAQWEDAEVSAEWDGVLPVPEPSVEGVPLRYVVRSHYWEPFRAWVSTTNRTQSLDGVHCATIRLCPVWYEPRTRVLKLLRSGRIVIRGQAGPRLDFATAGPTHDSLSPLAAQVLGWPDGESGTRTGLDGPVRGGEGGSGGGNGGRRRRLRRYLAVGSRATLDAIRPLLDAHRQEFEVLDPIVVDPEDGELKHALPEERASWIAAELAKRSADPRRKPHYVLLAGGARTIPFHYYPRYRSGDDAVQDIRLLSDQWYAGFDRDKDGTTPQFALGRLPFDEPERLRAYCVRLGGDGTHGWTHWLFMAGAGAGEDDYKSNVAAIIDAAAAHELLASHAKGPAMTAPPSTGHVAQLLQASPSIATFRGHGLRSCWLLRWDYIEEPTRWPQQVTDLSALPRLSGMLSVACCAGTTDSPASGCSPCLNVEECGRQDALGVSAVDAGTVKWFIGSTRPSYTEVNHEFHKCIMEAICGSATQSRIGDAHRAALDKLLLPLQTEPGGRPDIADTAAMSILLGDPAAMIAP